MHKPHSITLPNGIRYIPIPLPEQRTATVLVLVATGSAYETKKENGIAHFLEHMCFKGTTRRPLATQISMELDALGAEYNAFTTGEYTGYYAKVAAHRLPEAVDLVADLFNDPLLPADEIEREKGVIEGEIAMYEDMPMRKIGDDFQRLLYGDQPAGWSVAGEKETIRTFTRKDFLRYRASHYRTEGTVVIVAGSFDPARISALVRKQFSSALRGKAPAKKRTRKWTQGSRVAVTDKASDQTHLMLGVPAFGYGDKRRAALTVLSAVLGGGMSSRLFVRLREKMGVGYYVYAGAQVFIDHGFFAVSAGVDSTRVGEVIPAILEELSRMKDEYVDPAELVRVKALLSGRIDMGLESSDEYAEYFGIRTVLGRELKMPDAVKKELTKVTADEVRSLARVLFRGEGLRLAVIGPKHDPIQLEKLLIL